MKIYVEEPRCTHCGEDRLIEKISRPIWSSHGLALYYCGVCGRTFPYAVPPKVT